MCLRAIKTKHYSCSTYLSSVSWAVTLTYTLNRLSSFQNLRRKGSKFDHRPERPKVLLRHCNRPYMGPVQRVQSNFGDRGDRLYKVTSNFCDWLLLGKTGSGERLPRPSLRKEVGKGMVETGGVEQ